MKSYFLLFLILLASCSPSNNNFALQGKAHTVRLSSQPSKFPLNELFSLNLNLPNYKPGMTVKIDATMPSHGHGMNTQPVVKELGNGKFKVEGMQLHMEGEWVLSIEILIKDQVIENLEHTFVL